MTMQIDPLLRALADPTRLRIMRLLAHMELAVGELAQVLDQSQPRVSRHIRILCEAALTERRKEGSWVFLKSAVGDASAPPLASAAAQLLTIAERDDPDFAAQCAADRDALTTTRAAREAAAAAYFARHAAEWDQIRTLHGAEEPVEQALLMALAGPGHSQPLGAVLDIGTGTGRIAELVAPQARHITAFDKSPEMLRIARARLQHLPAAQIDLVQGDFTALPFAEAAFDTTIFHQVLHYAQAPEWALAQAARVTGAGGRIAVVDFAAHSREELRERHAHARLGFTDDQMAALLTGAGFAPAAPVAITGGPLTIKIWTGTRADPPPLSKTAKAPLP